jgi:hypothetical protein
MDTLHFFCSQESIAEHRLMHFSLEAPMPQNQPKEQEVPKIDTDDEKRDVDSKEREQQRKDAEEKDAQKDQQELKKIEKKIEGTDKKELMGKIEKALKNLEGTDSDFQQQFQKALEAAGVKNLTVEVTVQHRGGGVVQLKEKDSGKVVVGFLATNDGTAKNIKWEAQEKKADTPEDREKAEKALRQKWLQEVAKDLKIDGKVLTLGAVEERAITPAEQHGLYVNGKHVGDICAGFEDGQAVRDNVKYDWSKPPEVIFKAEGFKEQVKKLEDQIRKKLGK